MALATYFRRVRGRYRICCNGSRLHMVMVMVTVLVMLAFLLLLGGNFDVVCGELDVVAPWRGCRWALQCARSSRDDAVSGSPTPPTDDVVHLYELWW